MSYLNRTNGYAPTGRVNSEPRPIKALELRAWHDNAFCPRVYGGSDCWCDLFQDTWYAGFNLMREVNYRDGSPAV